MIRSISCLCRIQTSDSAAYSLGIISTTLGRFRLIEDLGR